MSYKPGDSYVVEFTTSNPNTGAAVNADSPPTATADFDGSGTGAMALTVASLDAGRYKASGTIPGTRVKGDTLNVSVAATVAGVAGKAVVDRVVLDSKRVGDLNDLGGTAQTGDAYALGENGFGAVEAAIGALGSPAQAGAPVIIADGSITSAKFSVAAITGVASGFLEQMVQLWRRQFKRTTLTSTQLKTYADDENTVLTTQTVQDSGGTQSMGAAS